MKYVKTFTTDSRRRRIAFSGLAKSQKLLNNNLVTLSILGGEVIIPLSEYMKREESLRIYLKV